MEFQMIDLPEITIIGKEGFCTAAHSVVQALWQEANSHFTEIAPLAKRNADGSFTAFWGAMSDESRAFLPWTEGFSRGYYLAGAETTADQVAPIGWTKWTLPARTYCKIAVSSDSYGSTFQQMLQQELPAHGLRLCGAVCDLTDPATGTNYLMFPVVKA